MGAGAVIAKRLQEEHGVRFERLPDRVHTHNHGDLRDTFLVHTTWILRHAFRKRFCISTQVDWKWNGHRGVEVGLAPETSTYRLSKAKSLKIELDDNFSPYGVGLWVSEGN